jgi:hypothetical protein
MFARRFLAPVFLLCLLVSCAQGPAPIQPGTPAFFWAAAENAYAARDFVKVNDNLGQVLSSENEFTARARILHLVVSTGLVTGYSDLADAWENAGRYNRTNPGAFRDQARLARSSASQLALQSGETLRKFLDTNQSATISFALGYPSGSAEAPALLPKLNKGILLHGAEAAELQKAMLERGVIQAAARAVNLDEPGDKAAAIYNKGGLARAEFLTGLADAMYRQAKLFGPKKLDEPQKLQALCSLAQQALRAVPPNPKVKDLQGKIQGALGKKKMS